MRGASMSDKNLAVVQQIVTPIAAALNLDVEDIEIRKTGNRQLVRIILDKDGGIAMDEVAAATRAISDALDEVTELAAPFTLEVTSPGVDRPMTLPRHWRRNIGRLVRIELANSAPVEGRIIAATDAGVTLQVKQAQREFALTQISRAIVQVEFNRPSEVADGH
ncbi:MAG: ribosome maturation factor RimP [Actinobacteria bacterium]|jgi:ribosome maturation factor RimP|uniref:Unannotated protein n=1 Tax=freshwater metagenome TaxID=449393 RepID=A0A6J6EDP1_9ZZZZ|nr:ribosome maturation factor RimP [Actinomycetota bacterium]